ncbi:hypothetical protein BFJ69_g8196 [Fusarium oxysporum]|uniref:Uncharacterized protein n=1 Tax=Fusarium oxysporum TaxID=5507 RepID=A0A420N378_FUSOX|nr:hypothetical protein BFJ69_g8196 [Fusarium oxysporum]
MKAVVPYDVTSKINLWPISQRGRRVYIEARVWLDTPNANLQGSD